MRKRKAEKASAIGQKLAVIALNTPMPDTSALSISTPNIGGKVVMVGSHDSSTESRINTVSSSFEIIISSAVRLLMVHA